MMNGPKRLPVFSSILKILTCLNFLMASFLGFAQTTPRQVGDTIHVKSVVVYGKPVDRQTRCIHWHSSLDIIAIKFKCCGRYYPCYSCHAETTNHLPTVWPASEFNEKAILCGACGQELTIDAYMASNNTCPNCSSLFNPGCAKHYHLYFETKKSITR